MRTKIPALTIAALLGMAQQVAIAQHDHAQHQAQSEMDRKLAAMKQAKGDVKIEAMAALIEDLVAENKRLAAATHSGQKPGHASHDAGSKPMECPMMSKEAKK